MQAADAAEPSAPEPAFAAFKRINPCPVARGPAGDCPGHVVGHIRPLCAGGGDHVDNVQWMTDDEARNKARRDKANCRKLKRRRLR